MLAVLVVAAEAEAGLSLAALARVAPPTPSTTAVATPIPASAIVFLVFSMGVLSCAARWWTSTVAGHAGPALWRDLAMTCGCGRMLWASPVGSRRPEPWPRHRREGR